MVFDWFSEDLLNSMDDHTFGHSQFTEHSPLGTTTSFHNQFGHTINHYDAHNGYEGSSTLFGHSIMHHDALGHLTGTSEMQGSQLIHHDSLGRMTGRDVHSGNDVLHYDNIGRCIGRTNAFGQEFDAMGRMIASIHKY